MSKTAAILCRVSTDDQATEGHSLNEQEAFCREYAKRLGLTVVKVYKSQESSLADSEQRIEQAKALVDAENGLFKVLIVQDHSRFTSVVGNADEAIKRLANADVELHIVEAGGRVDIETPVGQYMFVVLTGARGVHLQAHIQSSIRKRARIMREEKRPAAGRPPWGRVWDDTKKRYEAIPKAQEKIQRAYKLIVRHGLSLNKAAVELQLGPTSLRKAIRQSSWTSVVQRLAGEEYRFACAALLTEKQQRELEVTIAANVIVRPRTKGHYLLQGLVRCGTCGATMTGQTSTKDGKRQAIYRHPPATYKKGLCVWGVPVVLLDGDVLSASCAVVSNSDALRAAVEQALMETDAGASDHRQRLQFLEEEMKRVNTRHDRTLRRMVEFEEDPETTKKLATLAKNDERRLAELKSEYVDRSRQVGLLQLSREAADMATAKLRALYWGGGAGTKVLKFDQQQEFVRTIIGRGSRESSAGVYVTMHRPAGGSKKAVRWRYRVQGALMVASNTLTLDGDFAPELGAVPPANREQVTALARIAGASPGIWPPQRPYIGQLRPRVQLRGKPSSGASPRCG